MRLIIICTSDQVNAIIYLMRIIFIGAVGDMWVGAIICLMGN